MPSTECKIMQNFHVGNCCAHRQFPIVCRFFFLDVVVSVWQSGTRIHFRWKRRMQRERIVKSVSNGRLYAYSVRKKIAFASYNLHRGTLFVMHLVPYWFRCRSHGWKPNRPTTTTTMITTAEQYLATRLVLLRIFSSSAFTHDAEVNTLVIAWWQLNGCCQYTHHNYGRLCSVQGIRIRILSDGILNCIQHCCT